MKKLIVFTFALLATLSLYAQNKSNEINILDSISDASFKQYLIDRIFDGKTIVTKEEAQKITKIKVVGKSKKEKQIRYLKGIEFFTGLIELNCGDNKLTILDLSKNTKLEILQCASNWLVELDLSTCPKLTILDCQLNKISVLDLNKNTDLREVFCSDNNIYRLDVSQSVKLKELHCSKNDLTSLDLSKNINLSVLYCENNPTDLILKSIKMPATINRSIVTFPLNRADIYDWVE